MKCASHKCAMLISLLIKLTGRRGCVSAKRTVHCVFRKKCLPTILRMSRWKERCTALFLTLFTSVTSSSEKHRNLLSHSMSQSPEEGGGLDGGASGVITPREGGLQPVSKGRGRAARGRSQTPQQRQQKSRAAAAERARSSAVTAGAAGGLESHGPACVPFSISRPRVFIFYTCRNNQTTIYRLLSDHVFKTSKRVPTICDT